MVNLFVSRNILSLLLLVLLTSCTQGGNESAFEPSGNDDLQLAKLSSYGIFDQNPANTAKNLLSKQDDLTHIRAVNDDTQVIIAVDVEQQERFTLDSTERKLRKKMNDYFSDMTVIVSTDQKLLIELKKLEDDIQQNKMSNDQLKKRLNKIKKLSKEET